MAREKAALVARLPTDGLAVLNADDPRVPPWRGEPGAGGHLRHVAGADYRAGGTAVSADGTTCTGHHGADGWPWPCRCSGPTRGPGRTGGLAVATTSASDRGGGRRRVGRAAAGARPPAPAARPAGSLLLDDTYNAAPRSVLAGLDTLAALPGTPRVAVLGDMAELGPAAEELHRAVGRRAAEVVDLLVTHGNDAAWIADAAVRAGLPRRPGGHHLHPEDAVAEAARHLGPDAVVLVKGSAAARMERVVARLLADGTDAAELLVRQDRAWAVLRVVQPDRPTWLEIDLSAPWPTTSATWPDGPAGPR